jgi:defect-in-organelle-trafficking protein DotC
MFIPTAILLNFVMLKFITNTARHPERMLRIVYICTLAFLAACTRTSTANMPDTDSLAGLMSIANIKKVSFATTASMNKIREMALRETALSLGAQSGLASEARNVNADLTKYARTLDAIYNFNALIIEPNILPPVLLEGRQTLNLADTQTIRLSDRTYKVSKQARFVTTAPNWRQYLWMDYQKPDMPNITLLPKTKEERVLWQFYVEKGWHKGQEQAGVILQESIARIKEDFKGMILYRKLLALNMVSAPFVSHTNLGITGDGSEIHIDDRVLRITALPALNTNSADWKAAVAVEEKTIAKLEQLEKEVETNQIALSQPGWRPVIYPVN